MKHLILIGLLSSSTIIQANSCIGKVDRVQLTGSGDVELISKDLYGEDTGKKLCEFSNSWKGVTPEVCRGWYSLILTTIAQSSELKIQYTDELVCSDVKDWGYAEAPHMLSDT